MGHVHLKVNETLITLQKKKQIASHVSCPSRHMLLCSMIDPPWHFLTRPLTQHSNSGLWVTPILYISIVLSWVQVDASDPISLAGWQPRALGYRKPCQHTEGRSMCRIDNLADQENHQFW